MALPSWSEGLHARCCRSANLSDQEGRAIRCSYFFGRLEQKAPNRGLRNSQASLLRIHIIPRPISRIALPFFSFRAALNLALQSRFNSPILVCGQPRSDFFGTDESGRRPSGQCRHE